MARPSGYEEISIADLRHRVALCTMHDVVDADGVVTLARRPVAWLYAAINSMPAVPSFQSVYGYSIKENQSTWGSHRIVIRRQSWIEPASTAGIYELGLKTSNRWYK